ncbi:hypothetical protein [Streptomyces cavourensis]|uniref:hypothetical protein n=1 Tax=Streptomyces cavourensis TaxID=67258 RepID=UPI0020C9E384|nr:hypothetical protein [Streptomyces cavourensis]
MKSAVSPVMRLVPVLRNLVRTHRLERAAPDRLDAERRRLLVRLVRHAQADVPRYRELIAPETAAAFRGPEDLPSLPVLATGS